MRDIFQKQQKKKLKKQKKELYQKVFVLDYVHSRLNEMQEEIATTTYPYAKDGKKNVDQKPFRPTDF